jgi:predicted nucleotidyltransferase
VSAVIYSIDELKRKIAPIAEKYNLPAVYIFGSYARNEATEVQSCDTVIASAQDKTATP